jgi:hypothetical protein
MAGPHPLSAELAELFPDQAYRMLQDTTCGAARHHRGVALTEVPLNAVILDPVVGQVVPAGRVAVRGWAMGPAMGRVAAVDLSITGGRRWIRARISAESTGWTWSLWEAEVELPPRPCHHPRHRRGVEHPALQAIPERERLQQQRVAPRGGPRRGRPGPSSRTRCHAARRTPAGGSPRPAGAVHHPDMYDLLSRVGRHDPAPAGAVRRSGRRSGLGLMPGWPGIRPGTFPEREAARAGCPASPRCSARAERRARAGSARWS